MNSEDTRPARNGDRLVMSIVEAIADAEDVDPLDLNFVLMDVIDTDALERLISRDGNEEITVSFAVGVHLVSVAGDGTVTVDEQTSPIGD